MTGMSGQVAPPPPPQQQQHQPGIPGSFPSNFNPQQQFYYQQQQQQMQAGYFPPGYMPQHGMNGMGMPQPNQMQGLNIGGAPNTTAPFSVTELIKNKSESGQNMGSSTPPPQIGSPKVNGPVTPGKAKKPKAEVSNLRMYLVTGTNFLR